MEQDWQRAGSHGKATRWVKGDRPQTDPSGPKAKILAEAAPETRTSRLDEGGHLPQAAVSKLTATGSKLPYRSAILTSSVAVPIATHGSRSAMGTLFQGAKPARQAAFGGQWGF